MTTLPIRASHAPAANWTVPGFSRVIAAIVTVMEVFAEAQEMSREAHKRYPFVAW